MVAIPPPPLDFVNTVQKVMDHGIRLVHGLAVLIQEKTGGGCGEPAPAVAVLAEGIAPLRVPHVRPLSRRSGVRVLLPQVPYFMAALLGSGFST